MKEVLLISDSKFIDYNFKVFFRRKKNYSLTVNSPKKILNKNFTSFFKLKKFSFVIVNFGMSGGIQYNIDNGVEILKYNTQNYLAVLNKLKLLRIKNLFFVSASCVYPKDLKILNEQNFAKTNIEETSIHYAASKLIGSLFCMNVKNQNNLNWITIIPATLYGEKNNNDNNKSHVINSFFKKFKRNKKKIILWGSGNVKREFLHVQDFIDAILFIYEKKIKRSIVNVGYGSDVSIKKLAGIFIKASRFKGKVIWDKSRPEGVRKKLLDSSYIFSKGWRPKYKLEDSVINLILK